MRTYDGDRAEGRAPVSHRAADDDVARVQGLIATGEGSSSAVLGLQRTAGNEATAQLLADDSADEINGAASPVHDVIGSGGRPLDIETRATMESALGADFSGVRIHDDAAATASAQSVQAHAYTVGDDVVFQSDQYEPHSEGGQKMLAHELTHVIQQRSGPVDGTPAAGGISISDPSDSFERAADANAERFIASRSADASMSDATPSGAASTAHEHSVQRDEAEDDMGESEMPVQRAEEEAPEEDELAG
jgi:hypothetical protein